eukprot:scaffold14658_cov67-Phaeocystis_antarctica.AAC.2
MSLAVRCVARGVEFGRESKKHLQGQNTPHATRARHKRTPHIMSHSTRIPNTYTCTCHTQSRCNAPVRATGSSWACGIGHQAQA